jgi:polysaccharide pyruvyl transferase WcaK-like protein
MQGNKNCSFLETPFKAWFFIANPLRPWQYKLICKLGIFESIKKGMEAFQWADVVISTGGDIFSSIYTGLYWRLAPIRIAASYKKPFILLGHSIGPFEDEKEYGTFKKVMKHVQLITARESISFKYLNNMKLKNTRIELTAEPAFYLEPDMKNIRKILKAYNLEDKKNLVGVAPSQAIASYSKISYDHHFRILRMLIRFLINELKCHVILIPHVHENSVKYDDRVICEKLYRELSFPESVTVLSLEHSAEEIRALASKLDLLIAERMHAAIAALAQNVPVFVVGYSVKAKGILGDIFGFESVEDYMVSVKEMEEEKLNKRIRSLLDRRSEVANYLSKVMPRIKEKAKRNFTLTMEVLKQSM